MRQVGKLVIGLGVSIGILPETRNGMNLKLAGRRDCEFRRCQRKRVKRMQRGRQRKRAKRVQRGVNVTREARAEGAAT